MKKTLFSVAALCAAITLSLTGCSNSNGPDDPTLPAIPFPEGLDGNLFVINEGNFQFSNSSITVYNPSSGQLTEEAFIKANDMKLGELAHSMTIAGNLAWIVVNNSNVVFAADPITLKEKGRIERLSSPRFFHLVNDTTAYISQLWDNRIAIINPKTYSISGHIEIPGMDASTGSTEQMVQYGQYVYCNCWSYQNRIIKIDTRTNSVVESLEVGVQPKFLVIDRNNKLWTLTDGGYEGSPAGYEAPSLIKIDAETFSIEKKFTLSLGDYCSDMCINHDKNRLFWINGDVWSMDVTASEMPDEPLFKSDGTQYYGLTVAPATGDIYVADAIDYTQNGRILRYSSAGELIGTFTAGVCPGAFCWYQPLYLDH